MSNKVPRQQPWPLTFPEERAQPEPRRRAHPAARAYPTCRARPGSPGLLTQPSGGGWPCPYRPPPFLPLSCRHTQPWEPHSPARPRFCPAAPSFPHQPQAGSAFTLPSPGFLLFFKLFCVCVKFSLRSPGDNFSNGGW